MSFKIATSKENIDVTGTAGTVANNLNYSSDYNTLKYFQDGTINVVANRANYYGTADGGIFGGTIFYHIAYGTVSHNLGYYPYFTGLVQSGTINQWNMAPQYFGDAWVFARMEIFASTANLIFQYHFNSLDQDTGFSTATFNYKIFRNNLGLS